MIGICFSKLLGRNIKGQSTDFPLFQPASALFQQWLRLCFWVCGYCSYAKPALANYVYPLSKGKISLLLFPYSFIFHNILVNAVADIKNLIKTLGYIDKQPNCSVCDNNGKCLICTKNMYLIDG
jgi:hypothetical protein